MNHWHDYLISKPAVFLTGAFAFSMAGWIDSVESLSWAAAKIAPVLTCFLILFQVWLAHQKDKRDRKG